MFSPPEIDERGMFLLTAYMHQPSIFEMKEPSLEDALEIGKERAIALNEEPWRTPTPIDSMIRAVEEYRAMFSNYKHINQERLYIQQWGNSPQQVRERLRDVALKSPQVRDLYLSHIKMLVELRHSALRKVFEKIGGGDSVLEDPVKELIKDDKGLLSLLPENSSPTS